VAGCTVSGSEKQVEELTRRMERSCSVEVEDLLQVTLNAKEASSPSSFSADSTTASPVRTLSLDASSSIFPTQTPRLLAYQHCEDDNVPTHMSERPDPFGVGGAAHHRRTSAPVLGSVQANATGNLEAGLAKCEAQLQQLEALARAASQVPPSSLGSRLVSSLTKRPIPLDSEELKSLRAGCQDLGRHLGELVESALECACDRSVPGAMEVFEQANDALERLVDLSQQCNGDSLQLPRVAQGRRASAGCTKPVVRGGKCSLVDRSRTSMGRSFVELMGADCFAGPSRILRSDSGSVRPLALPPCREVSA